MYIAMYGCDGYPAGYPFTTRGGSVACTSPVASGWLGAFLLLFIIIFGAYVLPTVLIGIVAISFDEATRRSNNMQVSFLGGGRWSALGSSCWSRFQVFQKNNTNGSLYQLCRQN
jgi:hypothetical protein